MSIFKCKMCGGTLEINNNETVGVCEYCGTKQTLPKLDNERKMNLYDRANHFRRNNEFDKAMGIYEQILNEDSADAESYWSIVLCRYGIEYVEDPITRRRIPTVNRAQFTSIFDDADYKSAVQYADGYQREIYESEANAINEIQKGILAISQKEEPFDVFICYKETDNYGKRTQDSVLAQELYYELVEEGFKVFFAKITLEDKLGQEYEPYIFAALNSAKVMVALGTKPEHFNAVWVKNEWSRYLALIKKGENKMLIPAYRDMDPYDLPEEFSHLQAQDMSKLGFMQDLVRGIKKIVENSELQSAEKESVVVNTSVNAAPLLERAFLFLEDGDWESADEYCEKVLDIEPKNAMAYLGKLMAELWVKKQENLRDCAEPFGNNSNYQKVLRFADETLALTVSGYNTYIKERNENARLEMIYTSTVEEMNSAKTESQYKLVARTFESIKDYKDSAELIVKCMEQAEIAHEQAEIARKDATYNSARKLIDGDRLKDYEEALFKFQCISEWKDSADWIQVCQRKIEEKEAQIEADKLERQRVMAKANMEALKREKRNKLIATVCIVVAVAVIAFLFVRHTVIIPSDKYNEAVALMKSEKYEEAITSLEVARNYKDSKTLVKECKYQLASEALEAEEYSQALSHLMAIAGYKDSKILIKNNIGMYEGRIVAGENFSIGLKNDCTVVAIGEKEYVWKEVRNWTDIVSISASSSHTVGLKSDGTVIATRNEMNDVGWTNITAISTGQSYTVGLKLDGTVVADGYNDAGQCNVSNWTDIVAIAAGTNHTIGLKSDGTVVATGDNTYGQCEVFKWTDIVAIAAGKYHTVGLKSDGTVVAIGYQLLNACETSEWTDIMAIAAGDNYTVGLKTNGTVVAVGSDAYYSCDVTGWKDIVAISAGANHTIGLKSDGTIVTTSKDVDINKMTNWELFE